MRQRGPQRARLLITGVRGRWRVGKTTRSLFHVLGNQVEKKSLFVQGQVQYLSPVSNSPLTFTDSLKDQVWKHYHKSQQQWHLAFRHENWTARDRRARSILLLPAKPKFCQLERRNSLELQLEQHLTLSSHNTWQKPSREPSNPEASNIRPGFLD